MDKPLFIFDSMTIAMKAKDILSDYGIASYLKRTHISDKNGCVYGLYLSKKRDKALEILRQNKINAVLKEGKA